MDEPSKQNIFETIVMGLRSRVTGSKLSRSEILLSGLVGLSVLLMIYALASNYIFVGTRVVLTIGDETNLDREDLKAKYRAYSQMNSVGSMSDLSKFMEEVKNREVIRILGTEQLDVVSSSELYSASLKELNLSDAEKSRSEIQIEIADILAEADITHSEFHDELSVNIYRRKFINLLRSDMPDEGNIYRLDMIRDSSNRIDLLVSEIDSGSQFAAAADRLGMQLIAALDGENYWLSRIEIENNLTPDVADWVLTAEESAISKPFTIADTDEVAIYRLSEIRVEQYDLALLSKWANMLFDGMVAERRESLSIDERFSEDDRLWLLNETGLQLR